MTLAAHTLRRRGGQRLSRERRTADIMATARAVFREKGYDDAAMAEVAARLGIVEGTIYRYFPTKRDLLIAVAEDWYEAMLADYDQQLKGIVGTRNRLRFMIWRHLTVMHDEPAMCRLVLGPLRASADYRTTSVYELNRQYTQRTLAIVEEGMASGELRAGMPLAVVRDMIYGGIEHHSWAYLRGEGDFAPEQAADGIVDIIWRGLADGTAVRGDALGRSEMGSGIFRGETMRGEAVTRLEQVARRLERLVQPARPSARVAKR